MKKYLILCIIGISFYKANSQSANITTTYVIQTDSIKAHVSSTMYGIFFEDINMAADGGVYAELVKKRSFEFKMPLMGWKEIKQGGADGIILVLNRG